MGVHVWTWIWRPEVGVQQILINHTPPYWLEKDFLMNLEFTDMVGIASQLARGSVSSSWGMGFWAGYYTCLALKWLHSPHAVGKPFTHWVIFLTLQILWKESCQHASPNNIVHSQVFMGMFASYTVTRALNICSASRTSPYVCLALAMRGSRASWVVLW